MDHIVYVHRSSQEMDGLLHGGRSTIVRGSSGKRAPYGQVRAGDRLFFATGSGRTVVKAAAAVGSVYDSPRLSGVEPECLIAEHGDRLCLTAAELDRWSQKKFLTLIGVTGFRPIVPFTIAARGRDEDDWLVLDDIDAVIE